MKKVLFVASEGVPFIKTGGLADVVGSLPKCIDKDEFDVRVVMPKYLCMEGEYKNTLQYITHFYMDLNWRSKYVGIFEAEYQGVKYYFIDNEYYFSGYKPYGNIYEDIEKFAFFSRAALSILPVIGFQPDIIHCHDWQTGLVPVYLKDRFHDGDFYRDMKSIMTIHNIQFQGIWDMKTVMDVSGLSRYYFAPDKLEAYGDANYLKGGIVYADWVTTVSETYAEEIKMPYYGEGLDGLMRARANCLSGIVNGIDTEEYNPATDTKIEKNYNVRSFQKGKGQNKESLQRDLGLAVDRDKFMIGIVSRLTGQKGFDLVEYIMDELCADDLQVVILGTGEERYENMFRYFDWKYHDKVSAHIYYSDVMSHRIYASCDAFLMPSLFEPCGLSQLMSLRYGTVPIVRETGGLKDTVEPYNEYAQTGTGFSFSNYNAHEMLGIIRYAKHIYVTRRGEWNKIVERGMEKDFSWNHSAKQYMDLYRSLLQ